jgi:hypothetical protein
LEMVTSGRVKGLHWRSVVANSLTRRPVTASAERFG